jgi:hypothetical protein
MCYSTKTANAGIVYETQSVAASHLTRGIRVVVVVEERGEEGRSNIGEKD